VNLKWIFMGQEKMTRVAAGLIVAQVVFAVGVFGFVRGEAGIIWVPILRLIGDLAMAMYFMRRFVLVHGGLRLAFTLRGARNVLQPALTMGAALGLGLASYNLDSVLLGFMVGPMAVGWYNAAYKPVTVALAMPVTYFLGLFPALSRTYADSPEVFQQIVVRSLRLTSIFALPVGVGGTFFAEPIIGLLFGPAYANSVPALQVLCWAAVLAILRGTYKYGLNAAGKQQLDLRCAGTATALKVGRNLLLIPYYGIIGAAIATVVAEVIWVTMTSYYFCHYVFPARLLPHLLQPMGAAIAMGTFFLLAQPLFWAVRAFVGLLVYLAVLLLLGQTEVRSLAQGYKARFS